MKKTIKIIAMAVLCLFLGNVAAEAQALKIGDTVPDITINNIINYGTKSVKLSDFKDRLLILDFWATWCGSCIPSLYRLDSLQQVFSQEMAVLPVTRQPENIVAPFMTKKAIRLPSVTSDQVLRSYFPHNSVPHQVWILNGVVKAITSHYSVTPENIRATLRQDAANKMVMKLDQAGFESTKPLLAGGNGGDGKQLLYQSVITGYIDGAGYHDVMMAGQVMVTNNSIAHLYQKAFEQQYPWTSLKNRCVLDLNEEQKGRVSLPDELQGEDKLRWFAANGYCFNLYVPGEKDAKAMGVFMREDLNRFFARRENIKADIEKRTLKCLVLIVVDKELLKKPTAAANPPANSKPLILKNRPFGRFADMLAYTCSFQPLPFVDGTEYTEMADISLNVPPKNIQVLRNELMRYGLDLVEEERDIDMLVISPKTSNYQSQKENQK